MLHVLRQQPWLLLPLLLLLSAMTVGAGVCVGSNGWEWPWGITPHVQIQQYQANHTPTTMRADAALAPLPTSSVASATGLAAAEADPADHDAWADAWGADRADATSDAASDSTADEAINRATDMAAGTATDAATTVTSATHGPLPAMPAPPVAGLDSAAVPPEQTPSQETSGPAADHAQTMRLIVWDIRLPRSLGAWLAGALLGLAGAVAQGLFRNPLADPYLLGSASGASLAVALAMWGLSGTPVAAGLVLRLGVTGAAFAGAALAVALTLVLARGVQHTMRLLLAGVVAGVVLGALTSLTLLMRPDVYQSMQSFLMGSTAFVGWQSCVVLLAALLLACAMAWLLATALDALALGEWTAHTLGLSLGWMRLGLVLAMALATGAAVAQTGLIAFVGLAAPHLVRGCVQVRHGLLLLLSAGMGGLLLCSADVLARWLLAPQELPVGVLTAMMGGAYLLWLMYRGRTDSSTGQAA